MTVAQKGTFFLCRQKGEKKKGPGGNVPPSLRGKKGKESASFVKNRTI